MRWTLACGTLHEPVFTVEPLLLVMSPEASIALEQIEAAHPKYITAQTRAQIAEGFAMLSVWNRLKATVRAHLDEDLREQFHGTVSLRFAAGGGGSIYGGTGGW